MACIRRQSFIRIYRYAYSACQSFEHRNVSDGSMATGDLRSKMGFVAFCCVSFGPNCVVATGAIAPKQTINLEELGMSHTVSIKNLLETLKMVEATMRDTAEPSVRKQLQSAIADLELLVAKNDLDDQILKQKALEALGRFLKCLPSIARIIEILFST